MTRPWESSSQWVKLAFGAVNTTSLVRGRNPNTGHIQLGLMHSKGSGTNLCHLHQGEVTCMSHVGDYTLGGFLGSGCAYYEFMFCTLGTLSSSIEKPAQDYLNLRNTKAHQSNNLFVISLNCKILKYLQCKFSLSLSHRLQLQWYCASLDICSYWKIPQH